MTTGGAEQRTLRTLAALLGLTILVLPALSAAAVARWPWQPSPWTAPLLAAFAVPGLGLAAAARLARIPVVRGVAAAAAGVSSAVTALVPALHAAAGPGAVPSWPLGLTALSTTAVALLGRPALCWVAVPAAAALVGAGALLSGAAPDAVVALQDVGRTLFLDAVFAALALRALREARELDAAEEEATAAAVASAVERVRQDERSRVDAVVHDRVLATLLSAGRGTEDEQAVEAQAAEALSELRALASGAPLPSPGRGVDLLGRLRAVTTALAPAADLQHEATSSSVVPSPPEEVVDAMLSAVGEALRNIARHAPDAAAAVRLDARAPTIEIVVVDDGPGFDPQAVPRTRLGIERSIVARMHAAGGAAEVRSRPGHGTAVRVTWPR